MGLLARVKSFNSVVCSLKNFFLKTFICYLCKWSYILVFIEVLLFIDFKILCLFILRDTSLTNKKYKEWSWNKYCVATTELKYKINTIYLKFPVHHVPNFLILQASFSLIFQVDYAFLKNIFTTYKYTHKQYATYFWVY